VHPSAPRWAESSCRRFRGRPTLPRACRDASRKSVSSMFRGRDGDAVQPLVGSPRMDLDLPSEHQLLRSTIRDFMVKEVAPVIDEHERAHSFPVDVVRRLGEMGWLGIPIPEDEGGAGMDTLAYAIAVEEIGRVWGSLGLIVAAHTSLGCGPLHLAGTKEQKDRYLVPMASGSVIGANG